MDRGTTDGKNKFMFYSNISESATRVNIDSS